MEYVKTMQTLQYHIEENVTLVKFVYSILSVILSGKIKVCFLNSQFLSAVMYQAEKFK